MALKKMTITAFSANDFLAGSAVGDPFKVLINPATYKHTFGIRYNRVCAQDSIGSAPEFNRMEDEKISFDLVFDATGVIPTALPGLLPVLELGVADQIKKFRALIYDYAGAIHSPYYLQLEWGSLIFPCRLESMNVAYTLFRPDGAPLRAKVSLGFVAYMSEDEMARRAGRLSPDLSHQVTVRAGDTLPLLCHRIYGDSRHYLEVARVNSLTGFRGLQPGTQLIFPPLQAAR